MLNQPVNNPRNFSTLSTQAGREVPGVLGEQAQLGSAVRVFAVFLKVFRHAFAKKTCHPITQ